MKRVILIISFILLYSIGFSQTTIRSTKISDITTSVITKGTSDIVVQRENNFKTVNILPQKSTHSTPSYEISEKVEYSKRDVDRIIVLNKLLLTNKPVAKAFKSLVQKKDMIYE